jgi:uncharacterized repeat protein (TIGR03803 family)
MRTLPFHPTRRQVCAAALLGGGLAASGWAQAKKPSFRVIFDFPAGEAPVIHPLNSDDGHGQMNRLNIITATEGWRLNFNTGANNSNGAYRVNSPTTSHLISLGGGQQGEGGGHFPKCYGTETLGGAHGHGAVIWWHTTNRHAIHKLHLFAADGSEGLHPMGGLIQGFDGALYGTTHDGGLHGAGTVFRITAAGAFSVLHHFDPAGGGPAQPTQTLTRGPGGDYYGACHGGGQAGAGALYRMAPDGTMTTLFSFDDAGLGSGSQPHGALALGKDGRLYGLASKGGEAGGGTLFALSSEGEFTRLHSFLPEQGTAPMNTLLATPEGKLYGTCSQGGAFGNGTVFKYQPRTGVLRVLHHLAADGSEGSTPMSSLTLASNGYLYGTARDGGRWGGGTLYRVAP